VILIKPPNLDLTPTLSKKEKEEDGEKRVVCKILIIPFMPEA
jgi:hypothetical protein